MSAGGQGRAVLVVDDLRTFTFDAVHVRTSADAIAVLASCVAHGERLDEIWLDYNLGGGDTGDAVVAWLVDRAGAARDLVGEVMVHSSDPVGASRMLAALRAAGYAAQRRWPGEPGAELR